MSKFNNIVDVAASSCDGDAKYNDRYSLTLYKKGASANPKTAIVILKNPASTCKDSIFFSTQLKDIYDVDKTTAHIINILFTQEKYEKIITLNLFPYYDNIPATINSIYGNILHYRYGSYAVNLQKIDLVLKCNSNADIFCAWGESSGIDTNIYDKAIGDILNCLLGNNIIDYYHYVNHIKTKSSITNNKPFYPTHGLKW